MLLLTAPAQPTQTHRERGRVPEHRSDDLQRGTSTDVIARHLRTAIECGEYRHRQQLPTTRALAEEWHTSVATITRAMKQLADDGLIVNRARSSRVVNYPGPEQRPAAQRATPTVLLIGGYAGSGKTEFGRILARLSGWPILDKDSTTRPVVEAALERLGASPHDRESDLYMSLIRPAEYEALRMVTAENVRCGNSAVVTAPFVKELADPAWSRRITADVEAMSANLHAVWLRCDTESMHTYLSRRGAARDSYKLSHWDDYIAGLDMAFTPALPHTIIQNSLSSRPLQEQAAELLAKWN